MATSRSTLAKGLVDLAILNFASAIHRAIEPFLVSLFLAIQFNQFSPYIESWFETFIKIFCRFHQVLGWPLAASAAGYFTGRSGPSSFSLSIWCDRFVIGGLVASTFRQTNKDHEDAVAFIMSKEANSSAVSEAPQPSRPFSLDVKWEIVDLFLVIGIVALATLSLYLRDRAARGEGEAISAGIIAPRPRIQRQRANRPPAPDPQQATELPPVRRLCRRVCLYSLSLFLYKAGTTAYGMAYQVKEAHHGNIFYGNIFYEDLVAVVVELMVTILVVKVGTGVSKLICALFMMGAYPAFLECVESTVCHPSTFYSMMMSVLINGPVSLLTEHGAIDEHNGGKSNGVALVIFYTAAALGDALAYSLGPITGKPWRELTKWMPMLDPLGCSAWIAVIALSIA